MSICTANVPFSTSAAVNVYEPARLRVKTLKLIVLVVLLCLPSHVPGMLASSVTFFVRIGIVAFASVIGNVVISLWIVLDNVIVGVSIIG